MVVKNIGSFKKKLGDILVEVGIISQDQLDKALEMQKTTGGKLGDILKELNYCSEDVLLAFLGRQCGTSYISLSEYGNIPPPVLNLVPESVARHQTLIPISQEGNVLTIAMSDPLNVFATDDLKLMTGCDIKVVLASESEIKEAIEKYYVPGIALRTPFQQPAAEPAQQEQTSLQDIVEHLQKNEPAHQAASSSPESQEETFSVTFAQDAAPVIKMVNAILSQAIRAKSSDIHIEPYENSLRVRYRLDGVLHNQPAPPKKFQNALISRLKVMAQMDIAERRLPQDGRIKLTVEGREVDLRISTIPTPHGEKIVMRILDSTGLKVDMSQLGFEPAVLESYKKVVDSPHGIILVTGPTGSGKTTTLYSTLSMLNRPDKNIITIEDPIEYLIDGINQVQARPEIGLNFAAGLRAFLRQDPNIMLVGEIRDKETAEIAINGALTGHLLFSTLHTNDAPGAITRLNNMGIEPFLTASTTLMITAQRLMRLICPGCKIAYTLPAEQLLDMGAKPDQLKTSGRQKIVTLYKGKGCDACAGTGYQGRVACHEILIMNDWIRELILARASHHILKQTARKHGMMTLREAALLKMLRGETTLEEVLRVTTIDSDRDITHGEK
ncbi:MAG TPA: ATPase, T2SS/T4P/T4SS family [Elusimicrobiota bacterium]|nr:ATPase, T2SS/T4P/T4SS family [Elusimicrobiota bacterium]